MFGNKQKKEKRFKILTEESSGLTSFTVIQDRETGVQYLFTQGVNGCNTTVLYDSIGQHLVTEAVEEEQ